MASAGGWQRLGVRDRQVLCCDQAVDLFGSFWGTSALRPISPGSHCAAWFTARLRALLLVTRFGLVGDMPFAGISDFYRSLVLRRVSA